MAATILNWLGIGSTTTVLTWLDLDDSQPDPNIQVLTKQLKQIVVTDDGSYEALRTNLEELAGVEPNLSEYYESSRKRLLASLKNLDEAEESSENSYRLVIDALRTKLKELEQQGNVVIETPKSEADQKVNVADPDVLVTKTVVSQYQLDQQEEQKKRLDELASKCCKPDTYVTASQRVERNKEITRAEAEDLKNREVCIKNWSIEQQQKANGTFKYPVVTTVTSQGLVITKLGEKTVKPGNLGWTSNDETDFDQSLMRENRH